MPFKYRITLIYLLVGAAWIIITDQILVLAIENTHTLTMYQTYKGWFYVLATAVLLYFLVNGYVKSRDRANADLMHAKEKAEESDRLKTAFLKNISHEIRTPMNGIIGFSELLRNPSINNEQRMQYTSVVIGSSQQLLRLVNDIIDISRLETGQLPVNSSEFDLNALMTEMREQYLMAAGEKNLMLHLDLPPETVNVVADRDKIRQILWHLMSNSVKFTSKGYLRIGFVVREEGIRLMVEDTGIGIPDSAGGRIFDRFYKPEDDQTRSPDGTGLGLAISRGLTGLMGGSITYTSEVGKGTIFLIDLPCPVIVIPNKKEERTAGLKKSPTILIAEDEEINFLYMKELIGMTPVKNILRAGNGSEAIGLVESNPDIDLVLMDVKMPVVSGYEATRTIKKLRPDLPVIAITAYGMSDDRLQSQEAGCDDFLAKPTKKQELFRILNVYLGVQV